MINVLVVDDSTLTRKAIRRIIEMTGLDVGAILDAENGQQALELLSRGGVDLVLADLNMPQMGGMDMICHMWANEATRSIPVVVISTESSTTRIESLTAQGVRDYLHKPFTPEQMQAVIERALGVTNP
jgi:two-component system, chemotaxis family, chemotaxis protein CheY